MDFLNAMYSNNDFGIILFIFISILVLAFLVVLFFGKKDQKERELAKTEKFKLEKEDEKKDEVAFTELQPATMLETPSLKVEETEISKISTPNQVLNEDLIESANSTIENAKDMVPNPHEDSILAPQVDFDFDALAESISKELESIGVSALEKVNLESEIPKANTNFSDIKKEEIEMPVVFDKKDDKTEEEPINSTSESEKTKIIRPAQFSSVFVNKKKEKTNETTMASKVEETRKNEIPQAIPNRPNIELPKTIDLPKLNTSKTPNVEPIIKNDTSNITFPSLENDDIAYPNNAENRM